MEAVRDRIAEIPTRYQRVFGHVSLCTLWSCDRLFCATDNAQAELYKRDNSKRSPGGSGNRVTQAHGLATGENALAGKCNWNGAEAEADGGEGCVACSVTGGPGRSTQGGTTPCCAYNTPESSAGQWQRGTEEHQKFHGSLHRSNISLLSVSSLIGGVTHTCAGLDRFDLRMCRKV